MQANYEHRPLQHDEHKLIIANGVPPAAVKNRQGQAAPPELSAADH
jgi:hypothetical protein